MCGFYLYYLCFPKLYNKYTVQLDTGLLHILKVKTKYGIVCSISVYTVLYIVHIYNQACCFI
jgi:hypothetical protein